MINLKGTRDYSLYNILYSLSYHLEFSRNEMSNFFSWDLFFNDILSGLSLLQSTPTKYMPQL